LMEQGEDGDGSEQQRGGDADAKLCAVAVL
jgi:hypothetical protein